MLNQEEQVLYDDFLKRNPGILDALADARYTEVAKNMMENMAIELAFALKRILAERGQHNPLAGGLAKAAERQITYWCFIYPRFAFRLKQRLDNEQRAIDVDFRSQKTVMVQ